MRWMVSTAVGLATLCITLPFLLNADWLSVVVALILAGLWIGVPPHGYDWTSALGLVGFTLLAAAGTVRYDALLWMLPGIIAAVAAWDLSQLTQRLTIDGEVRQQSDFLRTHFWQLGLTLAASWLLALLATRIQIQLTFLWALVIVSILVLSLRQVVKMARGTER